MPLPLAKPPTHDCPDCRGDGYVLLPLRRTFGPVRDQDGWVDDVECERCEGSGKVRS